MEKVKRLTKHHTYITHKQRQWCGESQRDRGRVVGRGGPSGEKWGWKETLRGEMGARGSVQMMFY